MSAVWKILFLPLLPFIGHPERAWIVAGLLAIFLILLASRRTFRLWRLLPILLAALAWGGFGVLEQQAVAQGWNIRVDLFLVAPILDAVSIWAAWAGWASFRSLTGQRADGGDAGPPSRRAGTEGERPDGSALP